VIKIKKIILSLLLILLAAGAAAGAAYALFSDTAEVKGMSITTGDANLQIAMGSGWEEDHILDSSLFANMYPGFVTGTKFKLKNISQSAIDLKISAYLSEVGGDWNQLKDLLQMALIQYDGESSVNDDLTDNLVGNAGTIVKNTGWQSLKTWRNNSLVVSGPDLAPDEISYYAIWVKLADTADNSIDQMGVDLVLELTGEQTN
jgi:hypothetical protein